MKPSLGLKTVHPAEAHNDVQISVIIPTCDRPSELLQEAVQSALRQTLRPIEIIVIDNGQKPQASGSLPESVKYHKTDTRIGPSRARNIGASMAKGTHLAFLDDDDWWSEDFLFHMAEASKSQAVRCVYGTIMRWKYGQAHEQENLTAETATIDVLVLRNPGAGGINVLIEKELFLEIGGFDEELPVSEDRALAIEVLRKGEKIGIAHEAIAFARQHDEGRQSKGNVNKHIFVWKYRGLMPRKHFIQQFYKYGVRPYFKFPRRKR
ncbi:glycosyltransferase family 2 protein [Rhodosalinus sp. FB01]|uniref:glycosyltransferase family 2 protein n=1 Tax=Rhodosalinus sp. FB01 TaxID=3239194 RepID=UPI0035233950